MKNKIILILIISLITNNYIIINKDTFFVREYHTNVKHYATIISKDLYTIYENYTNKNINDDPYNIIKKTDKYITVGYYKEKDTYLINCTLNTINLNNFIENCKVNDKLLDKNKNNGIYKLAKTLDMVKINEEIKNNFNSNHIISKIIESYYFTNTNGADIFEFIENNMDVLNKINHINTNINKKLGTFTINYNFQNVNCTSIIYDRRVSDFIYEKNSFRKDPLYKPVLKIQTTCN
jgi:hypothetical protein